jgi:hypothetical protein
MSSFEFLSVFISVIVGLGMANMLTGAVQLLHRRHTIHFSVAHMAWTLFVFFMMVVYWWTVVFGWKDWEDWNVLLFLFLLLYAITLFLLSAILYPADIPESWDTLQHFIDIRRWFFAVEILWILCELTDTHLKDHFDDFALPYFLMIGSWFAAAVWGWVSSNRRIHTFIAVYHLVTVVFWIAYQFRDLEWTQAALGLETLTWATIS